ncbi:MAG: hypothetical protein H0T42_04015 [Deltaproteobacteria bacterium]|nr:hypothetical protein [Deltaproteobacteria bacterium]
MRTALALLFVLTACEPDYADTAFRCDATHGCPSEQSCEGGRCRRGGMVGEVFCGAGGTCTGSQQCCVDGDNPPRCIPAGDTCPNGYGALCDGLADCQSGDVCCDGALVYCRAACEELAYRICTLDADCPSSEPHCCFGDAGAAVPWGTCAFRACGD